ncbi:MAG: AgmX/PglI C-terminal domain-containing protein [Myxococcales bacterium]|nr:AgmX/PglI C-terminal domain-containing protein [Myxococcales bacterium]
MRAILLLLLMAGLLGCRADDPQPPAAPAPAKADADVVRLLRAAGDAPVIVVARLDRWAALHGAVSALAAGAPPEVKRALATAEDPSALVRAALEAAGLPAIDLQGLDPTRPVVAALFVPPSVDVPGLVGVRWANGDRPFFQHHLVLPTADPGALTQALRGPLAQAGQPQPTTDDAAAWQFGPLVRVAVRPAADHVRVDVEIGSAADTAKPWPAPTLTPPTLGPALLAAAAEPHALAVVLRGHLLRPAYAWYGAQQASDALDYAAPEVRDALRLAALRLILLGEAVMDDAAADFDAHLLAVSGEPAGLRIRTVSALTPRAAEALGAAETVAPFGLKVKAPLAQVVARVDARPLVDRAVLPAALRGDVDLRGWTRTVRECGAGCLWYATLRAPFGVLRALDGATRRGGALTVPPPRLLQAVAVRGAETPAVAVAAELPKGADVAPLRAALDGLGGRRGPAAQVHVTARGDHPVLLLGVGVDPTTIFDVDARGGAAEALSSLSVDPTRLAATLPQPMGAMAAGALSGAGPLRLEGRLSGRALVGGGLWALAGETADASPPLNLEGAVAAPALPAAPAAVRPCLDATLKGFDRLAEAVSGAPPAERATITLHGVSELESSLTCLAGAPATRPLADGLRRASMLPMAEDLVRRWQPEKALVVLAALCEKTSDAAVCARRDALKAAPTLALPRVKTCNDSPTDLGVGYADVRVQIDAQGAVRVAGRPGAADAIGTTLAAGRVAKRRDPFGDAPLDAAATWGVVEIAADAAAPASAVAAVLEAARVGRAKGVSVVARDWNDDVVWLRAGLLAAPEVKAAPTADRRLRLVQAPFDPDEDVALVVRADDVTAPTPRDAPTVAGQPPADAMRALRVRYPEAQRLVAIGEDATPARWAPALAATCEAAVLAPAAAVPTHGVRGLDPGDVRPFDGEGLGVLGALGGGGVGLPIGSEPKRPAYGAQRSREAIQAAFRRHTASFRRCYDEGLKRNPALAGKVNLAVTIAPSGDPTDVTAASETLGDAAVIECLLGVGRSMRFRAAAGATQVNYPLIFSAN